jgi:hypothetical protein
MKKLPAQKYAKWRISYAGMILLHQHHHYRGEVEISKNTIKNGRHLTKSMWGNGVQGVAHCVVGTPTRYNYFIFQHILIPAKNINLLMCFAFFSTKKVTPANILEELG